MVTKDLVLQAGTPKYITKYLILETRQILPNKAESGKHLVSEPRKPASDEAKRTRRN